MPEDIPKFSLKEESSEPGRALLLERLISVCVFLWLLVLYTSLLFCVIGTLSSYQFQQRARAFSTEDYDTVSSVIKRAEDLRAELDSLPGLEEELERLTEEVDNLERELEVFRAKAEPSEAEWAREAKLAEIRSEMDLVLFNLGFSEEKILELFDSDEYEQALEYQGVYPPEMVRLLSEFKRVEGQESLAGGDAETLERLRAKEKAANTARRKRDRKKNILEKKQTSAERADKKILLILDELKALRNVGIGTISFGAFAEKTSSILVLFLTLAMGSLGSTIFITQDYIAHGTRGRAITWYLIRPLLGMVTAVAIFVLAKAGQISISESAESLNPWVISFLAIISGLLSEQAIRKISDSARPFFRTQEAQPERWALGLKEMLSRKGVELDQLAEGMNLPRSRLEQWADQVEPVPFREQELIAAWLNQPVREIFTDIAPPRAGGS